MVMVIVPFSSLLAFFLSLFNCIVSLTCLFDMMSGVKKK